MPSEIVEVDGHIIDSLILAKVADLIFASGADYRVLDIDIGKTSRDPSHARMEVTTDDEELLSALLSELQLHGVNPIQSSDVQTAECESDGVFPAGFYATTNLPTSVRIEGHWVDVVNSEMDCGLVVGAAPGDDVRTVPMHKVRSGDRVVVGNDGVRVHTVTQPRRANAFEFMTSEASSEKPKSVITANIASRIRKAKDDGGKVVAVCGPAVVHTGAGTAIAQMIKGKWVDVLFAGNGFATHDIESNVMGTSLGVSVQEGTSSEGGHSNHLRVINEIRRYGSIANAVEAGYIDGGVMYECIKQGVPFVLAGSVRDDGPLPDVYTDVVEAADAMRYLVPDVAVALMFASTLHAVATGNILPSGVQIFCVDINESVVTKLADRGSHQALGVVTDVGLFAQGLADQLCRA